MAGKGPQEISDQFEQHLKEHPAAGWGRQHFSVSHCSDVTLLNSMSKTSPIGYSYKNCERKENWSSLLRKCQCMSEGVSENLTFYLKILHCLAKDSSFKPTSIDFTN